MAHNAVKTEHAGAKHGNGAYWGPKAIAKEQSNKLRRRNGINVVAHDWHICDYSDVVLDEYGNDTGFRLCRDCLEVEP